MNLLEKNNSQNQTKRNVEAPKTKILQILPRENKQNYEVAQYSKDAPKSNTTKAFNSVKTIRIMLT